MSTPYVSVTPQTAWTLAEASDGSSGTVSFFLPVATSSDFVDISEPHAYAFATNPWVSQLKVSTDIRQYVVIDAPADGCQLAMLKFFGLPEATPSSRVMARGAVWGLARLSGTEVPETMEYIGEYLGRFDLTIGSSVATGSQILPKDGSDDSAFGRRATVQVDRAMFPGLRVAGATSSIPSNAGPVLLVDALGYHQLIVELRCYLPANAEGSQPDALGFVYRFA